MIYLGTRWFKADLHVHTPASECFIDKSVTPQQWVHECLKKGLDCVAVTDHNTGSWIDQIKAAAEKTNLIVFPGLELTCSDAKVHLLILFDKTATTQAVNDFILTCNIKREEFSLQDAHSPLNVIDVLNKAQQAGAIVIPAHIDEFNGLHNVGYAIQENIFKSDSVLGVQVIHKDFTMIENDYQQLNKNDLLTRLISYYGLTVGQLSLGDVRNYRTCVEKALNEGKAILTFSDNPHQQGDSKHGLWGIGNRFTWIKMGENPNLESLRQALLLPELRIINHFTGVNPRSSPDLWIEKIEVSNITLSDGNNVFSADFSPQMTSIIGGRGSGKSSLLRFIIGVLNRGDELKDLTPLYEDFEEFFKIYNKHGKRGILTNDSVIKIYLKRFDDEYRLIFQQSGDPKYKLEKHDGNNFVDVSDENPNDLFDVEIFSQKQIFEIAIKPNALRQLLDDNSDEVREAKRQLEETRQQYFAKKAEIRKYQAQLAQKSELITKYKDLERKFEALSKSGLKDLTEKQKLFRLDDQSLNNLQSEISLRSERLAEAFDGLNPIDTKDLQLTDIRNQDLNKIINDKRKLLIQALEDVKHVVKNLNALGIALEKEVATSRWQQEHTKLNTEFSKALVSLHGQGVNPDLSKSLIETIQTTETQIKGLSQIETNLKTTIQETSDIQKLYFEQRKNLSIVRKNYLSQLLSAVKNSVKVKVKTYQDRNDLQLQLREILSAEDHFDDDFRKIGENLPNDPRQPTILTYINKLIGEFSNMASGNYQGDDFSGHFSNKVAQLSVEGRDKLELLLPEDEIIVEYRTGSGSYIPIAAGSAGQKTAAILTLILSYRTNPLILDQPEDDLDNSLISDLIVEQLRKSKEFRQIIVVTHNANIPVNGDTELIIVMDSKSSHIKIDACGTIENTDIKDKICEIMEGGTAAFEMRAKRYNLLDIN